MSDSIVTTPAIAPETPSDTSVDINDTSGTLESQDTQEGTVEASKPEAKEIKAEIKRLKQLKIKVDGKEFTEELPFDLPDDPKTIEYMTKQLQMARMGQGRAQQYSKLEKDVKDFFDYLKSDPKGALSDPTIGLDLKKLATTIIEEEIENSKKSPEVLEREKLEAELKRLQKEREDEKKTFQEKEFERLQQQEYLRYDTLMKDALDKSDLPQSPYIIKKMADYMLLGLQQGHDDMDPMDVIPLVREEMHSDLKEMFKVMPDDVIESLVGKDTLTRLRKKGVSKAKAAVAAKIIDTGTVKTEPKVEQKQTFKEFFKL